MNHDAPRGRLPLDIDAALANPSAYFDQPKDVLDHPGLSHKLRLKLLQQWEQDARLLSEAETEGMGGGEENMLGRVHRAIRALEESHDETDDEGSIGSAARNVADGVGEAVSRVHRAAAQAHEGVTEIRSVIRAQPITAGLLLFAFGYLFGRLGALIPSPSSRR